MTTVTDPQGNSATYVYNADDQLTDTTDYDGRRVTYSYDSGGQQTGETWVGASPSEIITYTYDADNELTGAKDTFATLTFTYDSGGNQITAATSGPGAGQPSVTLTSGYDPNHDLTSLADNLSSAGLTTLQYDAAFRLTTITTSYGGTAGPQVVLGYDPGNRDTSISRTIGGSGTQVNTTLVYDAANRLTTILDGSNTPGSGSGGGTSTAIATYVYGYDNANRVTTEVNAEGTVTYTYDSGGELLTARGSRTENYSYDSGGNRNMSGYTTSPGNELTASPGYSYTYDNEGNMTGETQTSTGDVWTFGYDDRNRMISAVEKSSGGTILSQATYTYDALNRRIGFDDNGTQTWTVYDGQNPYADFNGSGTLLTRYASGPALDEILARTSSGGTTAWYLTDRLGSVRDIVNTSGTVIDHIVYDSYGNVVSETNPTNGDRFKYTGREYDSVTGLYYYRARYYDPVAGTFISQDPKGFGAEDMDLYDYVRNQPTGATDPSGTQQVSGNLSGGIEIQLGPDPKKKGNSGGGNTQPHHPPAGFSGSDPYTPGRNPYPGNKGVGGGSGRAPDASSPVDGWPHRYRLPGSGKEPIFRDFPLPPINPGPTIYPPGRKAPTGTKPPGSGLGGSNQPWGPGPTLPSMSGGASFF
jgi:RHS repeat-associated protein